MTATTFTTQRQLMRKNMPESALTGQYAQQQKILLYVLPVVFAVGGIAFPIGVLLYWSTSNLWTMGQQFYVIRNNPTPGTPAFEAKKKRDALKHHGADATTVSGSSGGGRGADAPQPPPASPAQEAVALPAQEEEVAHMSEAPESDTRRRYGHPDLGPAGRGVR